MLDSTGPYLSITLSCTSQVQQLLEFFDFVNINIASFGVPLQCLGLGNFEDHLAFTMFAPVVLAVAILLGFLAFPSFEWADFKYFKYCVRISTHLQRVDVVDGRDPGPGGLCACFGLGGVVRLGSGDDTTPHRTRSRGGSAYRTHICRAGGRKPRLHDVEWRL